MDPLFFGYTSSAEGEEPIHLSSGFRAGEVLVEWGLDAEGYSGYVGMGVFLDRHGLNADCWESWPVLLEVTSLEDCGETSGS